MADTPASAGQPESLPRAHGGLSTEVVTNRDVLFYSEDIAPFPILVNIYKCGAIQSAREIFARIDPIVLALKKNYQLLGAVFLGISGLALTLSLVELAGEEKGASETWLSSPAFHLALMAISFGALVLSLYMEYGDRKRQRWIAGRFLTESIRQWYGQLFLDGRLMDLLASDTEGVMQPEAFAAEVDKRWALFHVAVVADPSARATSFMEQNIPFWYHERSVPQIEWVRQMVYSTYNEVRFNRQVAYFASQVERYQPLDERTKGLANTFFLLALVATLADATYFVTTQGSPGWLGLFSIFLALGSLLVRVYRSAMGISELLENYHNSWVSITALQTAFLATESPKTKLELMEAMEGLAMEELGAFLRIMRKSNFLF